MKLKPFALAAVILLNSCAYAPKHYEAPKAIKVHERISNAQSLINRAQGRVSTAVADIVNLEILTVDFPVQHKLAMAVHSELDELTKLLQQTQAELIGANMEVEFYQEQVQELTDKLNIDEQKIADLTPKHKFSIVGILWMVGSFVTNPMGFLVGKTVNLIIGLGISIALLTIAAYVFRRFRRWRRRKALTPPK